MTGSSSFWLANPSTSFYNGVVEQSLRLDGSTAYLMKTYGADASSTNKFALSMWVKIADVTASTDRMLASSFDGTTVMFYLQYVGASKTFRIYIDPSSSGSNELIRNATGQIFRDPSNWYHIALIVDMTLSGNENKARLYVNGDLLTTVDSSSTGTPTTHNIIKNGTTFYFSRYFTSSQYFSGYYADVHLIDGAADYTDFAETKNGVWIPKAYSGSYGNNGARLQFKEIGDGQSSPSSSTIGADTSGLSTPNHFQDVNLDAADSNFPDCPENNLATWNPLVYRRSKNFSAVFSEGNTKVNGTSSQVAHTSSTIASTGKHYAEFYINNASKAVTSCGVVRTLWDGGLGQSYAGNYGGAYYATNGTRAYNATSDSQTAPGSDRVGIEVDFANNEVEFFTVASDGTRTSRGGKLTSSDGIDFDGEGVFTATTHDVSSSYIEAYFSETSWNGTPNSGYEEMSASKLPDVTIGGLNTTIPTDHFNTVRYTGASSASQSITTVGFKPDWLWVKSTSNTSDHYLYDSTRNADAIASLSTNDTGYEDSTSGQFTQFTPTGFDLPADSAGYINYSGRGYKAWCWKANGGTTTTNDASSTSIGTIDSVFQANDTSGFSIVTYTGTGSAGTVRHGLSVAPSLVIIKSRTTASPANWVIGQDQSGFTGQNYFTDISAFSTNSGSFNNTAPTSSVVSIGTDQTTNGNTATYVMYCFANVDGFSRIGSYEMNARSDGPFIYTGFRPAWLLTRPIDQNGNWSIYDSVSDPFNDGDANMAFAGNQTAESGFAASAVDFLSNGFKMRQSSDGYSNTGSTTAIYMAFAEQPFKFSNAR